MEMREKSLEIPSESNYIRKTSEDILKDLESLSLDKTTLFVIKLCIEEALRNAMIHGNRMNESLPVKVRYKVADNRFSVEIEDQGKGFDYKHLPDPTVNENLLRGHGRGVFLINHLMDEVRYNDRGNIIKMIKFLSGGKDGIQDGK